MKLWLTGYLHRKYRNMRDYVPHMMGSLKSQRSWMMTMSVTQSYSHTRKEKKTKSRGMVWGWDTNTLSSFRNLEVTHWQAAVGHTKLEETSVWDFLGITRLASKKFNFSFFPSSSKNILAASRALLLPRRSRGCLVSPALCNYNLLGFLFAVTCFYLIADRMVCFTPFSVNSIPLSSATFVANHCLASALSI